MFDTIIIDGFNWFTKCYMLAKKDNKGDKHVYSKSIEIFLSMINSISRKYLTGRFIQIIIGFDNPVSKLENRREIDPGYKIDRLKREKLFYRCVDYLQLLLLNYSNNIKIVYRHKYEFDDVILPLILHLGRHKKILVCSDDLDFSRLIDYDGRNIKWYANKQIFDKDVFKKKYGFHPSAEKVILYKTIRGDKSDKIEIGIPNLPKDKVFQLMDDYKDIYAVIENLHNIEYLNESWKSKIIKNKTRLYLNHQLVDFIGISEEEMEDFLFQCKYEPFKLLNIYKSLKLNIEKIDRRVLTDAKKNDKVVIEDDWFQVPKYERI